MKVRELVKELSYKQIKILQNKLLVENTSGSSIVRIGDRKFAVTSQQRDELISYLETAKTSRTREIEGEDGQMTVEEYEEAVAESASPDEIRAQIIDGLKEIGGDDKANKLLTFIDSGGPYEKLAVKDGGLLEALKLIVMDNGLPALKNALFSVGGSPDTSGDVPVKIETPPLLAPLFDVYEPGRGDTMGRGEVLLAMSFSESFADSGGEYDVTLGGVPFHVKDLRGDAGEDGGLSDVDDSVALGKTGDWDKSAFPFNLLAQGGANLSKLSGEQMKLAMPAVIAAYAAGEVEGFPAENSGDLTAVAEHFQKSLNDAVVSSDSFMGGGKAKAGGVIFGAGKELYVCGPNAFHFARTSQSALRVTPNAGIPGLGKTLEEMQPYKSVLESEEFIRKVEEQKAKISAMRDHLVTLENLSDASSQDIEKHLKQHDNLTAIRKFVKTMMATAGESGIKQGTVNKMTPSGKEWDDSVMEVLRALAPEAPPEPEIATASAEDVAEEELDKDINLEAHLVRSFRGEKKVMQEHANQIVRAQHKAKPAIRRLIHESLSAQDKDQVKQLAGKVVDEKWKKELEDKVEALLEKQARNFFNNDHFYKAVADVWKQLMRVYAQDQYQYARRYTRYDVPLAKYRP